MITIDLLKNHPHTISRLAEIWHEVLGKIWLPEIGIEEIESLSYEELKQDMPLSYIALYGAIPVGFCTLQLTEDFRPDLGPWITDLVVDPKYQKQGISKMLLDVSYEKFEMEFGKIKEINNQSLIKDTAGRVIIEALDLVMPREKAVENDQKEKSWAAKMQDKKLSALKGGTREI